MNLEGLTLKLLADFLQKKITGCKINRVYMPHSHAVLFELRRAGNNYSGDDNHNDNPALLADLRGDAPALYLPDKLPENPDTPPAFCMLLRKHLEEGRITKISQENLERVLTLEIDLLGGSGKIVTKKLICELAGRNSNLILAQDGVIIDSLRHVTRAQNSYRVILPGEAYLPPPPQDGLNILTSEPERIVKAANNLPSAYFAKALVAATIGIGQATAAQLLAAADILPRSVRLETAEERALASVIRALQENLAGGGSRRVYALSGANKEVRTILALPPQFLPPDASVSECEDINSAINFAKRQTPRAPEEQDKLRATVRAESAKLAKKIAALEHDLQRAEDAPAQRVYADSIMAHLYELQRGQDFAELENIYDGAKLRIPLDPRLSPAENAQAYYKKYNKYKRAQSELRQQIANSHSLLEYLASLDASLAICECKSELEEIRAEMAQAGLVAERRNNKKKKAPQQKSQPLRIKLRQDALIYIGKNNKQNDFVTFTLGMPRDLWFHAKNIPGSHVLLQASEPQEEDILLAASLAAYFSKARTSSNVPVDCTRRRYVKKPAGARPGFVIFTNQRTYYVTPEEKNLAPYLKNI